MMKRLLTLLIVSMCGTALLGQDFAAGAGGTKLGPRDVLEIMVVQDPKMNVRVTISDDGYVTLAYVGKIDTNGLTVRQLEDRIKSLLEAKVLNQADVSVQVVQFGNKPISVVGAVARPGTIQTGGNMTLIQAITSAGGLTSGYGKTLYVLRSGQNGLTEQLAIDIEDLLINGNPDLNIPLEPNDVINVQVEPPITIYLIGEVQNPGKLEMRRAQNPSLLQAIAAAGGPTDRAGRTLVIKRAGSAKQIRVNYRRIAEGDDPDIPLQDGDTIYVKESFF